MGCHFLLQGIFPTQELNPGLLPLRQILYRLSYEGRATKPCLIIILFLVCYGWLSVLRVFGVCLIHTLISLRFPGGSEVKASASDVGDPGSIPGLGRSPGEGNGNPPQYSCLENPMDREAR